MTIDRGDSVVHAASNTFGIVMDIGDSPDGREVALIATDLGRYATLPISELEVIADDF